MDDGLELPAPAAPVSISRLLEQTRLELVERERTEGKVKDLNGEWKDPLSFAGDRERSLPVDLLRTSKSFPRELPSIKKRSQGGFVPPREEAINNAQADVRHILADVENRQRAAAGIRRRKRKDADPSPLVSVSKSGAELKNREESAFSPQRQQEEGKRKQCARENATRANRNGKCEEDVHLYQNAEAGDEEVDGQDRADTFAEKAEAKAEAKNKLIEKIQRVEQKMREERIRRDAEERAKAEEDTKLERQKKAEEREWASVMVAVTKIQTRLRMVQACRKCEVRKEELAKSIERKKFLKRYEEKQRLEREKLKNAEDALQEKLKATTAGTAKIEEDANANLDAGSDYGDTSPRPAGDLITDCHPKRPAPAGTVRNLVSLLNPKPPLKSMEALQEEALQEEAVVQGGGAAHIHSSSFFDDDTHLRSAIFSGGGDDDPDAVFSSGLPEWERHELKKLNSLLGSDEDY
jgi:hypothetical protein